MPCFFCALVPPPSGTLPPLTIAWPPRRGCASTRMTDAPASRATMAAGMPVAPDPITTTSASECHATIDILRVVTAVVEPCVESVLGSGGWRGTLPQRIHDFIASPYGRNLRSATLRCDSKQEYGLHLPEVLSAGLVLEYSDLRRLIGEAELAPTRDDAVIGRFI